LGAQPCIGVAGVRPGRQPRRGRCAPACAAPPAPARTWNDLHTTTGAPFWARNLSLICALTSVSPATWAGGGRGEWGHGAGAA
jgi:hypothetical protein